MILVKIFRFLLISWLLIGEVASTQNLTDVNAAHSPNLRIYFVNPAAAAWRETALVVAGYQLLNTGLGATFSNGAVSFIYPTASFGAFGVRGQSFQAHLLQQNQLEFCYSYPFWKHRGALGLNLGLLNQAYDASRFKLEDPADPLLNQKTSKLNLNLGLGALLEIFPKLIAGLSLNHLNQPNLAFGDAAWKMPLQWHAGLFYAHPWISPLVSLEQDQAETYFAIGAEHRFLYYNTTLRGSYSPENLTFGVACQFSNFLLDYAYHYPLTDLSEISSGSHEFFIGYEFGAPQPDFELSLEDTEPVQLEKTGILPGETARYVVKSHSRHGFHGQIYLALQNLPPGIEAHLTQPQITADGLVEIVLTTSAAVQPGVYPIQLQGTAGKLAHDLALPFKIMPLPRLLAAVKSSIDSLKIIENLEIREEHPILNYIFFNENEARLSPERYHLTKTSEDFAPTDELGQTALHQYRDILNILGRRLQQHPRLNITLLGYTSSTEPGNTGLARQRAQAVQDYLCQTWQIPTAQINLQARGLPEHPSADTELGRQENQRVEIIPQPGSETVLAAMVTSTSQTRLSDSTCTFQTIQSQAEASVKHWEFQISDDTGQIIRRWEGQTTLPQQIHWNWKDNAGRSVVMRPYFSYQLTLVDRRGQVSQSLPARINTNYQVIQTVQKSQRVEKFRLILFEFASEEADLASPDIQQKLAQIVEKFKAAPGAA
ncbi:type IX secretion system membrane protein PorP/SprF, partial [candidate division KSB1 bacterium]|nr:type IX secretion system membrane protein PorP/SprF [candidate division KSB1 bacterium]